MNVLFAHHLEAHHLPVLICLFAAGVYIGWQVVSRLLTHRPAITRAEPGSDVDIRL